MVIQGDLIFFELIYNLRFEQWTNIVEISLLKTSSTNICMEWELFKFKKRKEMRNRIRKIDVSTHVKYRWRDRYITQD